MGVAHVVTPGSPRPCHQPNRNPLHPDPGVDAGDGDDTEDMYFRLGFSHRFTSPILLYIVGKMTGIDSSCSDIHRTPKG